MNETWKPIPNHPNYEVSDFGRVRSLPRFVRSRPRGRVEATRWVAGKTLKLIIHRGYFVVSLGSSHGTYPVHQLVAAAFHGPCPEGMVIDHIDTDKTNNRPSNLEYVTNSENVHRQYRTGLLSNVGQKNGNCKLSDEQIALIRGLDGLKTRHELARIFGVSMNHIRRVLRGQQRAA